MEKEAASLLQTELVPKLFSCLPYDVVNEVFDSLEDDKSTLQSCSLVWKDWCTRCCRNLFQRLVKWDPIWSAIRKFPERVASSVQHFELHGRWNMSGDALVISKLLSMIDGLPRLRTLKLFNCHLEKSQVIPLGLDPKRVIHGLTIACYNPMPLMVIPMIDVVKIIQCFRHILKLTLDGIFGPKLELDSLNNASTLTTIDSVVLCPDIPETLDLSFLPVTGRPLRILDRQVDVSAIQELTLPDKLSQRYNNLLCEMESLQSLVYPQPDEAAIQLHPDARLRSFSIRLSGGPYFKNLRWVDADDLNRSWTAMLCDLDKVVTANMQDLTIIVPALDSRYGYGCPSDDEVPVLLADTQFCCETTPEILWAPC